MGFLHSCLGLSVALAVTFGGFAARSEALCASAKAVLAGGPDVPNIEGRACDLVRSGDGLDQYFCSKEFEFRSNAATVAYEAYVGEIRACFSATEVPIGPAVNHPDSYHQTVFSVEGRHISVALKDKGALQKTYVFVRLPAN